MTTRKKSVSRSASAGKQFTSPLRRLAAIRREATRLASVAPVGHAAQRIVDWAELAATTLTLEAATAEIDRS